MESSITEHDNNSCKLCRGALFHQKDHYALGTLRIKLGIALGLSPETTQQLEFKTLLEKHAEAGHPRLQK